MKLKGGVGGAGERVRAQLTVKLKLQNKKLEKKCRNQKIRVCGFKAFVSVEMKQHVWFGENGAKTGHAHLYNIAVHSHYSHGCGLLLLMAIINITILLKINT